MTVFDRYIRPRAEKTIKRFSDTSDRMKRKLEYKKTLLEFRWTYYLAIVKKTGIRLPFRLISITVKAVAAKVKRKGL